MSIMSNRFVDIINALLHEDISELTELVSTVPLPELNLIMMRTIMLSDSEELLEVLLNAGVDINYQDREGRTALFLAVKYNRTSMVRLLIHKGCDVNLGKFNQSYALHLAAKKGHQAIIEMIVDAGHCLDALNWGGNTSLLIACRFGHTEAVKKLISYGANVNICNKLGHYPLHYAAFAGDATLVQILMERGANPDVRTHLGINPIMLACERKHCNVVSALASQCDLHYREQLYGGTVLHWAIASGCCHCVDCLLSQGASLSLADNTGRTPILEAVQSQRPEILKFLLEKHTVCDFTNEGPNTRLLHLAAFLGHAECTEIICRHSHTKHMVHLKDSFGDTPIDLALKEGCRKTTELLLQFGARISHIVSSSYSSSMEEISERSDTKSTQDGTDSTKTETQAVSSSECGYNSEQGETIHNSQNENGHISVFSATESEVSTKACLNSQSGSENSSNHLGDSGDSQEISPGVSPWDSLKTTPPSEIQVDNIDKMRSKLTDLCIESTRDLRLLPHHKIFKTYSAIKMGMIDMLRSASSQQMVAPVKFDFNTWLDNGPEAFVLKVTSLDLTNWIHQRMHTPWALREVCRGCIRRNLGYRASDKVELLPVPKTIRDFLNMKELEQIETSEIQIRSTGAFDDVDIE